MKSTRRQALKAAAAGTAAAMVPVPVKPWANGGVFMLGLNNPEYIDIYRLRLDGTTKRSRVKIGRSLHEVWEQHNKPRIWAPNKKRA
ncbi:MAG: twin-arginine translocation signal domain-containing protein [Terriglobales bacterium]